MRLASQGGTRPLWRGRSALPVRLVIAVLSLAQSGEDCTRRTPASQEARSHAWQSRDLRCKMYERNETPGALPRAVRRLR